MRNTLQTPALLLGSPATTESRNPNIAEAPASVKLSYLSSLLASPAFLYLLL